MNKKTILGIGAALLLVVALGFAYVLRPPEEASQPIEAESLNNSLEEASSSDETGNEDVADSLSENLVIFSILQEQSEVRFSIDEILRGNPFTAVGISNQIAGEIGIDFENPSTSELGTILINARTFQTDDSNRDRAIANEILDTGEFEYIRFTPINITGYPSQIVFGEPVALQITGDLTIRDITSSITFEVEVTIVSETEISGAGSATVLRADYGLLIPSVPFVAEVSEEVLLEIEFVAEGN